ncbi:Holliday junction resolvase RuvX [Candidatus Cytomitobacter indipagum]|uniref:Putative pre-16S rRNA nuclease n=1 Tax=Candidatus Cytomitobacter indipagum TaxID=2601575 RepID=A0A5C0UCS7_9PROT|nr:Holliday junction resolvase RuvX [Candidatus Cytomitobacter indipagum]QEK37815.1 Holliday junction resolvase RuvX [Candidatus Cytomitobacter indipagum]
MQTIDSISKSEDKISIEKDSIEGASSIASESGNNISISEESIPTSGVLIGLDYGEVRTGVAFCDYNQELAIPNGVYGPKKFIVDIVLQLIKERDVVGVIIGWPLNMKGEEAFQCKETQKFIDNLQKSWKGPIVKRDERCTSSYVSSMYSGGHKLETDDALSAMTILESFIGRKK